MQMRLNVTILMMCLPSWKDESLTCVGRLFDDARGAILCWRLFRESSASRRTVKRSTQRDAGQEGRAPKRSVEQGYTRHNRHVPKKKSSEKPRAR